jgi:outer membrane receptor protein involved in Fe transport
MINKLSILVLSTTIAFNGLSQTSSAVKDAPKIGVLTGRVQSDEKKENLAYTKIFLLDPVDSSVVTGGLTEEDGSFKIEDIPATPLIAKITSFGFSTLYTDSILFDRKKPEYDLGVLYLKKNEALLNEVEVVHETDAFQVQIDKKVFNVEKQITATGGTALDALENVPSVTVDMEGNVSLRGSANVTILIDGRPSSLAGGGRQGVLEGIPASAIESIEVITNPSAKYDPDGMSGIINIVLKKNKLKGFNGNVDLSLENGIHWDSLDTYTDMLGINYNLSGNLAFRNKFFNIYGGYTTRHYEGYRNNYSSSENWYNGHYALTQDREGTHLKKNHTFKGGMDFYINKKQSAGFALTGNLSGNRRTGNQWYEETIDDTLNAVWQRLSEDPSTKSSLDGSAYYTVKGKKEGQKLDVNAQYSSGGSTSDGNYLENQYDPITGGITSPNYLNQSVLSGNGNNISTFQLDYFHPINKGKIEVGAKSTFRDLRESYYQETNGLTDVDLVNRFSYNEQVHAAYGIFGKDYEKFKFQFGLRLEQVFVLGQLDKDTADYTNDYFSLYPSVHLVKPLTKTSEISLSYSRRVNRPHTRQLNPFARYSDPYNLRKGNPELNPEYINSVEVGYGKYGKKLTLTSSVYYRYMTDLIQRIVYQDSTGVSITQYQNLDIGQYIGVEGVVTYRPFDWWKMMLTGNVSQTYLNSTSGESDLNNSGISWSSRMQSTMTLKKNWVFQMTGYYRSPMVFAQGGSIAMYGMDAALKYSFMDNKMYLNFKVSDVFNTRRFAYSTSKENEFANSGEFKHQSRRFMLTFGYRFGNQDQDRKRRNVSSGGGGDFD